MKKIYLAGPGVFRQDAIEYGKELVSLCKKYGFIGLYPLDNEIRWDDIKETAQHVSKRIYEANHQMIKESDCLLADLRAFRGYEPDSGTVWECGFAIGIGKPVFAYTEKEDYATRVLEDKRIPISYHVDSSGLYDWNKTHIEGYGNSVNLMLANSIYIVRGGTAESTLKKIKKYYQKQP